MLLQFYPDTKELSAEELPDGSVKGAVAREIKKLETKHMELYTLVQRFLVDKIAKADGLQDYYKSGHLFNLAGGLHEMRIPKTRKGLRF